jgi:glycosyltransferase involved in cell wall biosynthesis
MPDQKVSIITPVYNGEKYLKNCLQCVLKQTYKNFEYVILDNASTDGTAEIIEKYASGDERVKVFRNSNTLKIIDNWNECLKFISADTKWVKYAFADDILFPNCVEEMVKIGEKDQSIGFVSAYHLRGRQVSNVGLPMAVEIADGKEMLKQHILRKLYVCLNSPNTVMYNRQVLDELGGFDNAYFHADTELAFRILHKYNLGFVHQVMTWTSINNQSGSTYALFHGIITKDQLRFGYKNIGRYNDISFSDDEIRHLSDHYAHKILLYISTHMVYWLWNDIHSLWSKAPLKVKKRIIPVMLKKWPIYLRKLIGSIVYYKANRMNKPTFKK